MTECPDVPWGTDDDDVDIAPAFNEQPAKAAVFFLEFLKSKRIATGRIVDLGCGKGRNAIFFVKNHFEVHAIDHKDEMLKDLELHGVKAYCQDVTDFLLFEDRFFDLAMDVHCYDLQQPERRKNYRSELRRILSPQGYYLLSVRNMSKEEIEKEFSDFEILSFEKDGDSLNFIMR